MNGYPLIRNRWSNEHLLAVLFFCSIPLSAAGLGLNVKKIADLVDEGRLLEAQTYNMGSCINCGICSYVCLAGKNLSGRIDPKKCRGI